MSDTGNHIVNSSSFKAVPNQSSHKPSGSLILNNNMNPIPTHVRNNKSISIVGNLQGGGIVDFN
jgi:hypothetical protein